MAHPKKRLPGFDVVHEVLIGDRRPHLHVGASTPTSSLTDDIEEDDIEEP